MATFLSDGKISSLKQDKNGVIHELTVRVSTKGIALLKIKVCAMMFNSTWQGLGMLEAKLARRRPSCLPLLVFRLP